ncbi:MAG: hypothetical protein AB8I08_05740 [Sandaracinaceae bacterium]
MSVDSLSKPARRAIFEALVAMAWADARLEREEIFAVQAAGRVLHLPEDALDALDAGPPTIDDIVSAELSSGDRRIVYTCAAWLARVDDREDSSEAKLLDALRTGLDLDEDDAHTLREDAHMLHVTTPSSTPWWQEIELLIERVIAPQ